jgi:WD40 repeat protein
MKTLFYILFLFTGSLGQSQYLAINPDGHKSTIRAMVFDNDDNIITAGSDKTVKVWDSKRGHIIKEFRGQIGPGSEGMIYAMDLSPNQKYLAVGGWFGKDDESESLGDVRIYDYQTGKLVKLINKIHENVIFSLKFTPDSKSLLIGDGDGIIVKWEFLIGLPSIVYETYESAQVLSLATANDYFVATFSNGMIYKCNYDKAKPSKSINFFNKPKKELNVGSIATISKDGEWVSIIGKELAMVLVFNRKMSMKQYFFVDNVDKVLDVNFSPSNKRLIVSAQKGGQNKAIVYELFGKDWLELTRHKHDASIMKVGFLDENTCVSAGGFNNQIDIWSIKNDKAKLKMRLEGVGQTYYSANLDGANLAYGLKADLAYGKASYSDVYDLFSRRLLKNKPVNNFNKPVSEKNGWSLKEIDVVRETDWDPSYILEISENGKTKASVKRYPWDGNRHRSFTFIDDKNIVSGGDYGILSAYNYEGKQVSSFVGHEDAISSVSVSKNGQYLVSASYDNTIRLWPMSEIGKANKTANIETMWQVIEAQGIESWKGKIRMLNCEKIAQTPTTEAWQTVIKKLKEKGYDPEFLEYYLNAKLANTIYPVVSIFVASNQEWVIWNNDGYFTSSKKGAKFIGYHLNKGKKQAAKFYPFEQFDLKYNRPDIIFKTLGIADQSILDLYYRAYQKRLKRAGLKETDFNSDIHIPTIKITSYKKEGQTVVIDVVATDDKYELNALNLFNNDVPIFGVEGQSLTESKIKTFTKQYTIDLMDGENKIQVSVMNHKGAESFKETIYIEGDEQKSKDLYVVSIGTSKYKDSRFDLKYAAKDAEDVSEMFEDNKLYTTVHNLLLTNERVTKENIFKIKDFLANIKVNDVVILFIAGHGVLNKDYDYYYCTHDMDFNEPEKNGISYVELEKLFDGLKAIRKLLIMDTCHSGEVDKDEIEEVETAEEEEGDIIFRSTATKVIRERKGLKQTNEIVKDMFNDLNRGTGTTVISAAGGVEFAMESDKWQNGLFTYCFLNGLKTNNADLNKDGVVYLSELQTFIRQEVSLQSNGKQVPTSRFENISLDYAIW